MGTESPILWCDHTANPWWGCLKISPACQNCYAESFDRRTGGDHWGANKPRRYVKSFWTDAVKWNAEAERSKQRRRVFLQSMGDFLELGAPVVDMQGVPMGTTDDLRTRTCSLIEKTPWLNWMILTKRIGNWRQALPAWWHSRLPSNVWMMITAGTQAEADRDIPKLIEVPAVVRGISMEPLLEYVILPKTTWRNEMPWSGIDFVIVGCESRPGGRPGRKMESQWAESIERQTRDHGVRFFMKQMVIDGRVEESLIKFPIELQRRELP